MREMEHFTLLDIILDHVRYNYAPTLLGAVLYGKGKLMVRQNLGAGVGHRRKKTGLFRCEAETAVVGLK